MTRNFQNLTQSIKDYIDHKFNDVITNGKIDINLNLAKVAYTGLYEDLKNVPDVDIDAIINRLNLSKVATSGNYKDLNGLPTIPTSENILDMVSKDLNLAQVAKTGNYSDLVGTPDYDHDIAVLKEKMDEITNPFNISSFTISQSTAQIGSSVSITLQWSYSKDDISNQFLNDQALDIGVRQKIYSNITTNQNYTIKVISTGNITKSKSVSLRFYNGVYYGKSSSSTYDANLIKSFTKVLSDSKARSITVNALADEYIFYCIPSRLGTPNFNVGGFDGGFSKVKTISFTNSDNYTENYDIYKSTNSNLGNTTVVIK